MKLKGLDYLGISSHFSEEEIMVQHSARTFVENEINPIIDQHFHDGTFPSELIPKFAEMGFLGINLPTEFGGGGMSNVTYGLVCQELEKMGATKIIHQYQVLWKINSRLIWIFIILALYFM